jgi:hypothetical protein
VSYVTLRWLSKKMHVVEQPVSITVPRYHKSQPSPGSLPRGFFPCWPLLAALKLQAIFYAVATSREGQHPPKSNRAVQHRRWGRERPQPEWSPE